MALNTTLTDAAKLLAEGISTSGGAARTSLGGDGTAFGWTGGLVPTVANYATPAISDGMTFKVATVTDTATPAGKVSKGAPKPTGTVITNGGVALDKFAGLGSFALEDALDSVGLSAAIASVLSRQCLKAYEVDAVAKLIAGAGSTVTGTDWVDALANAQAALLANGASPSVLVLPAALYGAFIGDVVATNAFSQSPESPVGSLLGTPVHVSSAPGTNAWVFDSTAVLAVEHKSSPLVLVDALSQADTNTARIVIDVVATTWVAASDGVVEITAPIGA